MDVARLPTRGPPLHPMQPLRLARIVLLVSLSLCLAARTGEADDDAGDGFSPAPRLAGASQSAQAQAQAQQELANDWPPDPTTRPKFELLDRAADLPGEGRGHRGTAPV